MKGLFLCGSVGVRMTPPTAIIRRTTEGGIPKGGLLAEVTPHLVVRMCCGDGDGGDDPTLPPHVEELPGWTDCPIWERAAGTTTAAAATPGRDHELEAFLRRLLRQHRQSWTDVPTAAGSWQTLCILATLQVALAGRVSEESQNGRTGPSSSASSSPHGYAGTTKEGSVSYGDDDGDDDDDDGLALLTELWPLIHGRISWTACLRLFRTVQRQLHVLALPHPLSRYAQETIFRLSEDDYERSCKVLDKLLLQRRRRTTQPRNSTAAAAAAAAASVPAASNGGPSSSSTSEPSLAPLHRLRASQLWLDQVANVPTRLVGVLLLDPTSPPTYDGGSTCSGRDDDGRCQPSPGLPRFQSCLPTTCLELVMRRQDGRPEGRSVDSDVVRCAWIALYDLPGGQAEDGQRGDWTVSTRPKLASCKCFQCRYEHHRPFREGPRTKNRQPPDVSIDDLSHAIRLANAYFQRESLDDAYALYRACHSLCERSSGASCGRATESMCPTSYLPVSTTVTTTAADLWHSMAAVLLSQRKFAKAQRHWKQGSDYKVHHKELALQREKQEAYQYFDPLPPHVEGRATPSYETLQGGSGIASSTVPVFVAVDAVDKATCGRLIAWAVEYADCNGGWTTSRHYAVPTTDLPVHQVPRLLEWFRDWTPRVLIPLLQQQFAGATAARSVGEKNRTRFYVHDAFLVRYEATASSNFLPLHYDESTHSCVVALNDDFEGGGTYMYHLQRSVNPSTGGMVSFAGNRCLHCGNPVTRGVRYILAIFLYLDEDLSSEMGHDDDWNRAPPGGSTKRPTEEENSDHGCTAKPSLRKRFMNRRRRTSGWRQQGLLLFFFLECSPNSIHSILTFRL